MRVIKTYLLKFAGCICLTLTLNVAAEQSLRAQNLQKVTPDYVSNLTIEDQGEGVKITGSVASSQDISKYMRFLDDSVGTPSLITLKRDGDRSNFILEIKKFRK